MKPFDDTVTGIPKTVEDLRDTLYDLAVATEEGSKALDELCRLAAPNARLREAAVAMIEMAGSLYSWRTGECIDALRAAIADAPDPQIGADLIRLRGQVESFRVWRDRLAQERDKALADVAQLREAEQAALDLLYDLDECPEGLVPAVKYVMDCYDSAMGMVVQQNKRLGEGGAK